MILKTLTRTRRWSEISYQKPPRTCTIMRLSNPISGGNWRKSTNDREGNRYRIMMRRWEQFLELVCFQRSKQKHIFLLNTTGIQIFKNHLRMYRKCWYKLTDLQKYTSGDPSVGLRSLGFLWSLGRRLWYWYKNFILFTFGSNMCYFFGSRTLSMRPKICCHMHRVC